VGAGQHFFVSAASTDWRACYTTLKLIKMRWEGAGAHLTVSKTQGTLTSAAFSSVSRVKLAYECGLQLRKNCSLTRLSYTAGFPSDVATLAAAHELGLKLSSDVVRGAAAARSMPTFLWLMTEQHCRLPKYITWTAVRSGSIEKLAWLKGQGCEWEIDTLRSAIQTGSKQLVEYLIADGCPINWIAYHAAAETGDLAMLKWLREQGCAWRVERGFANKSLVSVAACSGSIELLQWLREQGVEIGSDALISAAAKGRLPLCQHLRSEHVQWSEAVSTAAAAGGHYSTLRWLLDSGCPFAVHRLCCAAAAGCCMDTLTYVVQQHEPDAELLTHMLNAAGSCSELTTAQWLRARGAAWPATLGYLEEAEKGGCMRSPGHCLL
jgi:Ankyrin repeats (3 copies)